MNKTVGIIVGAIAITAIGFFTLSSNKVENTAMIKSATAETQMVPKDAATSTSGSYDGYSAEKIARAEDGKVVLFFHATWCPTCRALNGDIEKNAGSIPAGITILKTNYDDTDELKKKYGVTTQHTLVQVDKNGNLIKKWSGGSKLENLLSEII